MADVSPVPDQRCDEILQRLEILWHKLEGEGLYVGANTVHLAQRLIEDLRKEKASPVRKDDDDA